MPKNFLTANKSYSECMYHPSRDSFALLLVAVDVIGPVESSLGASLEPSLKEWAGTLIILLRLAHGQHLLH